MAMAVDDEIQFSSGKAATTRMMRWVMRQYGYSTVLVGTRLNMKSWTPSKLGEYFE